MFIQTYRPYPNALLNPCADPIFKILFTTNSTESHEALTCFLTDVIGKKVTDVVLQPNELAGESVSDKQSEFDINCKIDGEIVNIEMQGRNQKDDYGKRTEYHVAHLLNHYTPKGTDWFDTPRVYHENGRTISKILNVIFLELPKVAKLDDDLNSLTVPQMWGKFFLYGSSHDKIKFIEELAKRNRGIRMAFTVLQNVSQDELNWYHESRYWMSVSDEKTRNRAAIQRGEAKGFAAGESKGFEKGRNAEKLETAKNLIEMNVLTHEQISQATGLTLEQIENLVSAI